VRCGRRAVSRDDRPTPTPQPPRPARAAEVLPFGTDVRLRPPSDPARCQSVPANLQRRSCSGATLRAGRLRRHRTFTARQTPHRFYRCPPGSAHPADQQIPGEVRTRTTRLASRGTPDNDAAIQEQTGGVVGSPRPILCGPRWIRNRTERSPTRVRLAITLSCSIQRGRTGHGSLPISSGRSGRRMRYAVSFLVIGLSGSTTTR